LNPIVEIITKRVNYNKSITTNNTMSTAVKQTIPAPSTQAMIQGHLFNPETDTKYSKCKVNASGGKSVGIYNSQTGQSLYVGTPLLMTWGLQEYTDDKTGKVSYEMSLQFPNDDFETDETRAFLKSMADFEAKLKADALTNSKDWFAKPKMTPDAVDALFTPILKFPMDKATCEKDLTKKPTMRIKVPFWQGKWEGVEIYDADRNCLFPCADPNVSPMDIITKLSHMKTMIQCGGIWFANGKFGITWRFVQGMIQPRLSMRGKCHLSLSSSESSADSQKSIQNDHHSEGVHEQQQQQQQQQQKQPQVETVDSDDGGDEEEEDDSVPSRVYSVPVAAPVVIATAAVEAPKKKIVKKVGA
jgi:hypothetical protein